MAAVDKQLVARICQEATPQTAAGDGGVVDAVTDNIDGSVWVRMTSSALAQAAAGALQAYGLAVTDRPECRLQITGWDWRLLRRRLGSVLAGVDDLRAEWDATAELVSYHYDRRARMVEEPDPAEVLADVEQVMRGAALPIPHTAPATRDVDVLLQLIDAAEQAYQQLLAEHLEYAEKILLTHLTGAEPDVGPRLRPTG
jgi:hypothetical protein